MTNERKKFYNVSTKEDFQSFMELENAADSWDYMDYSEWKSACDYIGIDFDLYKTIDDVWEILAERLELLRAGKEFRFPDEKMEAWKNRQFVIYTRYTDDEFTADGVGDWDDGKDWETETADAETALNDYLDHCAETVTVKNREPVYSGKYGDYSAIYGNAIVDGRHCNFAVINKFNK